MGYFGGFGGWGGPWFKGFTSAGVILALFILLVIVACVGAFWI